MSTTITFAPGWHADRHENGWVARRKGDLTEYQRANGCLAEITATDLGELWILCDAQIRLAERVALAETARNLA
ncbi:hypothetical protein [Thermomonospora cellulosilytica]|uniref:Uncharacterized protein n=1 Tax=Thermomonospora cellulosilytica TaxID=1411118 RepID=A0A7W3MZZ2_9ACTN|nr:hypothetical protein [Thermomonospora cellulosilytica]MBA9005006.1 hypothetical protein [Thermomonospora cellulosilytica]